MQFFFALFYLFPFMQLCLTRLFLLGGVGKSCLTGKLPVPFSHPMFSKLLRLRPTVAILLKRFPVCHFVAQGLRENSPVRPQ
jgi:hypothetical protein